MGDLFAVLENTYVLFIAWCGGLWSFTQLLRSQADHLDKITKLEEREQLISFLRRTGNTAAVGTMPPWLTVFNHGLDDFFGEKHFSWRCLWRSAVISVFFFVLLLLVFDPDFIKEDDGISFEAIGILFIVGLVFNAIGDYFSLAQTRTILRWGGAIWLKVIVDSILTLGVWVAGLLAPFAMFFILISDFSGLLEVPEFVWLAVKEVFVGTGESDPYGFRPIFLASLFTAFTTSIWLWIHALGVATVRSLGRLNVLNLNNPYLAIVEVATWYVWGFGLLGFALIHAMPM